MTGLSEPAQYRGFTLDLIQHHAQTHMVAIIISKPHQKLVINSVTTKNQWKQSMKHVHQDLNSPVHLIIYQRETCRNQISQSWSSTKSPKHKKQPIQLSNTKIPIQCQKLPMHLPDSISQSQLSLKNKKLILDQHEVNILSQPIHLDQSYHFACHLLLGIPFHPCHLYHLSTS